MTKEHSVPPVIKLRANKNLSRLSDGKLKNLLSDSSHKIDTSSSYNRRLHPRTVFTRPPTFLVDAMQLQAASLQEVLKRSKT